jgi:hypothetical protein
MTAQARERARLPPESQTIAVAHTPAPRAIVPCCIRIRAARFVRCVAALIMLALLAGCARQPGLPSPGTGPLILRALPPQDVQLITRGTLRPQYRAAGIAGQPMPYEGAVNSSLMLCAGLGPLFGPCAGVLVGSLAVAGVTETLVDTLQQSGSNEADTNAVTHTLVPDLDFTTRLTGRLTSAAVERLVRSGRAASRDTDGGTTDCAAPARLAGIDIAGLELEFEPGYQYRLIIVARARTRDCGTAGNASERRLAYRSPLQVLSRDAGIARGDFEATITTAIDDLGQRLAQHLTGQAAMDAD